MAATATNIGTGSFCFSDICPRRFSPKNKLSRTAKYVFHNPIGLSSKRSENSFVIGASDPQRGSKEAEENSSSNSAFLSKEDLEYLSKLVGGSVVGAAAIKYGSAAFPEITRPNIVLAFIMITAPVVVAVFLLFKQSQADTEESD